MTKLSVNINKVATIRNARGGDVPNLMKVAQDCERFGAQGITVHPRPDERHIRYQDVRDIKPLIQTEFNIEGYPSKEFMNLVLENKPHQVTLVPDGPDVITSNSGWNTIVNKSFLTDVVGRLKSAGIRTSLFIETIPEYIVEAKEIGADRIELYTEEYASKYTVNKEEAVFAYSNAAQVASNCGLGINAGHDLDLNNLKYFIQNVPGVSEVSIGHALISDALYYGLENTIQMYLRQIELAQ